MLPPSLELHEGNAPSDADLVRAAQAGDAPSLAVLLERHRADMYAVALRIVGYGPDVEDVVQDAMVVALCRIGDVRDPGAVRAWLLTLVRNAGLMRLRRPHAAPLSEALNLVLRSHEPSADEILDHQALRDWVWHALEELTEPLQMVTLLRYFSEISSYEQIAALCDVPVGTVRSRLNQAKRKLAESLLATASRAHHGSASLAASRRQDIAEFLSAGERGDLGPILAERWWSDAKVVWPGDQGVVGLDGFVHGWDIDWTDGVRHRLVNVIASRTITIVETDLLSPPDDPDHCPPAVAWLQFLRDGRIRHMRLLYPQVGRGGATRPR